MNDKIMRVESDLKYIRLWIKIMVILTWNARKQARLTLTELEALTKISKTTLNNIENNKVYPRIDQLEAIVRAEV